jgi:uncharacterized protein (TIGR02246 family)
MTTTVLSLILCGGLTVAAQESYAQQSSRQRDEGAIRLLIAQREAAWNSGDVEAYGRLLTKDADIVSGTGRSAKGRESILALYVEQRAGAYKGASTATPIQSIRFLRADVAIVDTRSRVTGMRTAEGTALPPREGSQTLVVKKEQGRWLIAAHRSCVSCQ